MKECVPRSYCIHRVRLGEVGLRKLDQFVLVLAADRLPQGSSGESSLRLPGSCLHLLLIRPNLLQRALVHHIGDRHVGAGLPVIPAAVRQPGGVTPYCFAQQCQEDLGLLFPGSAFRRRSTSAPSGSPWVHSPAALPP